MAESFTEEEIVLARARVARGIAKLDIDKPDWRAKVDIDTIDVWSTKDCPLGQVYGSYDKGLEELGLKKGLDSHNHGFTAACAVTPPNESGRSFALLDLIWRQEIGKMQLRELALV